MHRRVRKIGSVVESDLSIFSVGEIHGNKLVSMDKEKPFRIKDKSNPMVKCVESGNYAVMAQCLQFATVKLEEGDGR